jgi:hypothetical protein
MKLTGGLCLKSSVARLQSCVLNLEDLRLLLKHLYATSLFSLLHMFPQYFLTNFLRGDTSLWLVDDFSMTPTVLILE